VDDVTIYHNPRCSKSRQACDMLAEHGVETEVRQYLKEPPSRDELEHLMALLGIDDPRAMMRTGEPAYRELGLADADRGELLEAIAAHPILLERPIVVQGDRAVIGRPPENILGLLD
jgi:arsenate reductase